jgi:hypothetical protein
MRLRISVQVAAVLVERQAVQVVRHLLHLQAAR